MLPPLEIKWVARALGILFEESLIKSHTRVSATLTVRRVLPGLALAFGIALAAVTLTWTVGSNYLSPIVAALALGTLFRGVAGTHEWAKLGVALSVRGVLRCAIALLGLQIALSDIIAIGLTGLATVVGVLVATMIFTIWLGSWLKVRPTMTYLIASGTSICGAAAILATATTLRARDEEVGYAIACITVFGTLSILLYPVCQLFLELSDYKYGFWVGASIHEVAQVAAAAFQNGSVSGEHGIITKLARVLALAPAIIILSASTDGKDNAAPAPFPLFIVAFVGFTLIGNMVEIPSYVRDAISKLTLFLFCIALAGVGLELSIRRLSEASVRPLLLASASWLFITSLSLLLVLQLRTV